MMTLTFMVVVADVADYKAMCSGWAGLGVIYQGGALRAVYPAHGTRGLPAAVGTWRELHQSRHRAKAAEI